MDPRDTRQFTAADGEVWTVSRDTGFRSGASASGALPTGGVRGLHFTNAKGTHRFLARNGGELPSRKELQALTEGQLRELLFLAK